MVSNISFYVPYEGKNPKVFEINGHRMVILSASPEALEESSLSHSFRLKKLTPRNQEENTIDLVLAKIAKRCKSGVVLAPAEATLDDILENLKKELPWIH
ncbi:MAG TPA: hypothetical protein PKD37_06100 [Oligoflexia bacterium]|nr:hypothetical protein [Oligoflexia bacterium]HMP27533.1 hypothetical protein [Oligoflexia bacterium]